ncbi:MAG: HPr family phosphocarrier protein [Thermoguttaceae bacterium]|nr:HPr family phosphocarrier protein [Thermoguttaceae bacterium]
MNNPLSTDKVTRSLTVQNKSGFHLRVASLICQVSSKYEDEISLTNGSYTADCKSMIDLLSMMAPCGTVLTLTVRGPNSSEIADRFTSLFDTKFSEDEFATEG